MSNLTCSCCGRYFRGKPDPSHDKGYGTCPDCEVWIEETFTKPACEDLERKVAAALNPENRAKFLTHTPDERCAFVGFVIERGGIKFSIRGRD